MTANPANPFDAQPYVFTIVTKDIETSVGFYRDILGYRVIGQGALDGNLPAAPGIGEPGRRYALLRARETIPTERGVIRLLDAPKGAKPNRPRPGRGDGPPSCGTDGGLSGMLCETADWEAAYRQITKLGIETISPPLAYAHRSITPLPGEALPPRTGSMSFSLYVPGGDEFLYFFCAIDPVTHAPVRRLPDGRLYGTISTHVTATRNRWPLFDFYEKVFGLTSTHEGQAGRETINTLCVLPPKTQFQFGFLDDMCMEWHEFRQYRPGPAPAWPTSLDKTGLAMTTFLIDDLNAIRARAVEHGYQILGEGALPTPEAEARDGFYIRGAEGELYEVIGRT
jgi:catechol 2,3-dioxygenase-like lactoylglutathione lyase family enzyme